MKDLSTSRRAMLGAIASAPIFALAETPALAKEADGHILAAWAVRQKAIEMIEARGPFFTAETHSPAEMDAYGMAEKRIVETDAATPQGLLAKAWVAWGYIGDSFHEDDQMLHALIRRAEFDALEKIGGLEYEHQNMRNLVRSLRAIAGEA